MKITFGELRRLIAEVMSPFGDWKSYDVSQRVVDLWHVTACDNVESILKQGLIPGYASMSHDGSPADAVYFHTDVSGARIMAGKLENNDVLAAVLHFRIPAKLLKKHDPKIDPEEEFSGTSIALVPDKSFASKHIVSIYTDHNDLVPKRYLERTYSLSQL